MASTAPSASRAERALRILQRQLASPPAGWFVFGTHLDRPDVQLEFWGDDGAGFPIWERPAEPAHTGEVTGQDGTTVPEGFSGSTS